MNFLNKLGAMFGASTQRTLVGKDKRGNQFYTLPPVREGSPPKRLVDYNGLPEPSLLHPLWKHWLVHARDTVPTDKDIFMWEMEQARLQRKLKEIDSASNKMRSEEMAERERNESGMGNTISHLTAHITADIAANQPKTKSGGASEMTSRFVIPPQAPNPTPGSNLSFEDGKQVIPKSHTPYSPDPSRIQSILEKNEPEKPPPPPAGSYATSTWTPSVETKEHNLDEL